MAEESCQPKPSGSDSMRSAKRSRANCGSCLIRASRIISSIELRSSAERSIPASSSSAATNSSRLISASRFWNSIVARKRVFSPTSRVERSREVISLQSDDALPELPEAGRPLPDISTSGPPEDVTLAIFSRRTEVSFSRAPSERIWLMFQTQTSASASAGGMKWMAFKQERIRLMPSIRQGGQNHALKNPGFPCPTDPEMDTPMSSLLKSLLCLAAGAVLASCAGPGNNTPSSVGRDVYGHRPGPKGFKTVIIDAGHGGKDPGAVSRHTGQREKDLALDTAQRIASELRGSFNVILMRSDDTFIDLDERVVRANRHGGAILVSMHYNSGPSGIRGPETYYWRVDS
ncbi:MAG: N-acetylmuramoyl-L-alanine amidase, partial [Verrucomicrobiaceae bacterium]